MGKKFKDIYEEGLQKESLVNVTTAADSNPAMETVKATTEDQEHNTRIEILPSFSDRFTLDEERRKIRQEMTDVLTEEVKEELKNQLREHRLNKLYPIKPHYTR